MNYIRKNDNDINITIFTCVYNGEKFLNKLFSSLVNQTSYHFNYFIYDDNSTDYSVKIIDSFVKKIKKRKLFNIDYFYSKTNHGVDYSHFYVIKHHIKTDYFMWLSMDDWLDCNAVEALDNQLLINNGCDFYFLNSNLSRNGNTIDEFSIYSNFSGKIKGKRYFRNYLSIKRVCHYQNFLIKKSKLLSFNPNLFFVEGKKYGGLFFDFQLLNIFALNKANFGFISNPITVAFAREDSLSRSFDKYDMSKWCKGLRCLFRNTGLSECRISSFINSYLFSTLLKENIDHNFNYACRKKFRRNNIHIMFRVSFLENPLIWFKFLSIVIFLNASTFFYFFIFSKGGKK